MWSCFDYLTSIGIQAYHTFRLSSIYDPHYTFATGGKNTSVRGMSIVDDLYTQYKVFAVKVTVKAWNVSNADVIVCAITSKTTSPPNQANIDLLFRQENTKAVMLQRVACGSEKNQTEQSFWIPLHMIQGLTKAQYSADDQSWALIGSNPAGNNSYLHIQAWNAHDGGFADPLHDNQVNVAQFGDADANVVSGNAGMGYSLEFKFFTQLRQKVLDTDL